MGWSHWLAGAGSAWRWEACFQARPCVDLPVLIENNGFQVVQDYRINARLIWRF